MGGLPRVTLRTPDNTGSLIYFYWYNYTCVWGAMWHFHVCAVGNDQIRGTGVFHLRHLPFLCAGIFKVLSASTFGIYHSLSARVACLGSRVSESFLMATCPMLHYLLSTPPSPSLPLPYSLLPWNQLVNIEHPLHETTTASSQVTCHLLQGLQQKWPSRWTSPFSGPGMRHPPSASC